MRLLASRFFMFESARSHHHIEHADEFLSLRVAAEAEGAGGQQPVAQKNTAVLDPVDPFRGRAQSTKSCPHETLN